MGLVGAELIPPAKSLALLETLTLARPVFFQLVVVNSDLNANPTATHQARINLAAPAAENEAAILGAYYVTTDEYNKALSGMIRLAVGRKGSGKTALFFRLRDKIRNDRQNVVLDLKPDGYQLKRFKFMVLDVVEEAVKEHVATAFWEYVLLLEICYKLLEKDRQVHTRDHTIYEPYRRLASLYETDTLITEGDFSERMLGLVHRISDEFAELHGPDNVKYLSASEVTHLIYKHDIPKLKRELTDYLQHKKQIPTISIALTKTGTGSVSISATDFMPASCICVRW